MKLVKPSLQYKNSFLETWKEFDAEEQRSYLMGSGDDTLETVSNNFDTFLARESANELEENMKDGRVPQTHFWLIDNDEVIGEVSLRHRLNEKLKKHGGHIGYGIRPSKRRMGYGKIILALALEEARKLGIKKALITCDETNIGSQKIIQANGGVLQDIIPNPGHPNKMLWWIDLA